MRQEYLPLSHSRMKPDRGAGLRALALLLGGWVVMRAILIIGDLGDVRLRPNNVTDKQARGAPALTPQSTAQTGRNSVRKVVLRHGAPLVPSMIGAWPHLPSGSRITDPINGAARAAPYANLAGVERGNMVELGPPFLAGSDDADADAAPFAGTARAADLAMPLWPMGAAPTAQSARTSRRFGLYAYLFVRPNAGSGATATSYGGSQMFVRAHWRPGEGGLGGRSMAYARVSRDLTKAGRAEFAIGGAVQPVAALPVSVHGERRVRPNGPDASAAFVTGGVSGVPLPQNVSLNAYAQGGATWTGGDKGVGFFDGQASLTMPVRRAKGWRADAGVLAAAGGQDDTARLDVGPVLTLSAGQNGGQVQGQVGWRFRVAGKAAPAHGPAITLSVGF